MQKKRLWIWESEEYPHFRYDLSKIENIFLETIKAQGILEGAIKHLSKNDQSELFEKTLTDEIINSSFIEGEILKRDSVRSSIKRHYENLDITFDDKHTDNIVAISKDLNENHNPLTIDRLNKWHNYIMTESNCDLKDLALGCFRDYDEMLVISGNGIKRKIHYQAPPAKDLNQLMDKFLDYINNSKDHPLLKSAITHIWFVQIHPYGDGNGRMARNITNHILSKHLGLNSRYFSISYAINRDIKNYGAILEETNSLTKNPNLDLSAWIIWHTQKIKDAINLSLEVIEKSIQKTKFYDKIKNIKLNSNQTKIIDFLLNGEKLITNNLYRSLTGTSQVTASRQLSYLVKKGILKPLKNQKGRSTAYELDLN